MAAKKLNVRRSIERLLFPELERRGFARRPSAHADNLQPYGEFQRSGVRGTDVFEVQFDKYSPSRFRIHLTVRLEGSDEGPDFYLGRRGLILRKPFGVRSRRGVLPTEAQFDAAVGEVIALLPEVEELFRSGRSTRRMEQMPERVYGFGRHRYSMGTLIAYSIPVVLVLYIAISLHLTISLHRGQWLMHGVPFALVLLAAWCWVVWKAHRR